MSVIKAAAQFSLTRWEVLLIATTAGTVGLVFTL